MSQAVEPAFPAADLLPVQRKATFAYRLARILLLPVLHALFTFQVSGQRNIPRRGAFVLIANHMNWLDSFAILAAFPPEPRVHFLGDPTMLQTRRIQWFVVRQVGGYIPVNKQLHGDPRLFEHAHRCLQRGGVVALYPEGEYESGEGPLLRFKKGFAYFAVENGVPVLPVGLRGTKDLWWRKAVQVRIGEPISPAGQTVDSLVALGQERLAALLPPYRDPGGIKLFRHRLTTLL